MTKTKHENRTLYNFLENDPSVTWTEHGTAKWTVNGCHYIAAPHLYGSTGIVPVIRVNDKNAVLERGHGQPDTKMGNLYESMYFCNWFPKGVSAEKIVNP